MRAVVRAVAVSAASALPLLLSGCFLLSTTRKLPLPKAPGSVQTVSPEELVSRLNQRWAGINTLTAKVDIQASVLHAQEGIARDYTSVPGVILLRKPEDLRVYVRVPVVGTPALDMVSNGKTFQLFIHLKNKVIEGNNDETRKDSPNPLENLRPGFFFDSMMARGLEPDDRYSVTTDVVTVEDAAKKHLYSVPEYILSIHRPKAGSQEDTTLRVVTFHRDDLLPYQQDIYDKDGNLETQVFYAQYGDFSGNKYPSKVTIKRPIEGVQLVLTVDNVTENMKLRDDQFEIEIPPGTPIQKLN
jgi:outer membrane lipoprotein-sorting protein